MTDTSGIYEVLVHMTRDGQIRWTRHFQDREIGDTPIKAAQFTICAGGENPLNIHVCVNESKVWLSYSQNRFVNTHATQAGIVMIAEGDKASALLDEINTPLSEDILAWNVVSAFWQHWTNKRGIVQ